MVDKKKLKVMFGNSSSANSSLEYKIDEVNVSDNWNPSALNPSEMGGFNFSTEDKILRWLIRGDTLYDVLIPDDAEVIDCPSESAPHGVFRTNKIIISNPRIVTDDIAMELYEKSDLPEKSYYKSLAGLAIRGHRNTAIRLIEDRVNKENISLVLNEIDDFVKTSNASNSNEKSHEVYNEVRSYLDEIASDLLISRFISKEPYIKDITSDKVINITGESGSGKSYFTKDWINDDNYIVVDTDIIIGGHPPRNEIDKELRNIFINKYGDNLKNLLFDNFDEFYETVLDYFKDTDKTIVIDSAQYRNMKDVSKLKGKIIVMRTDINTCYKRCLSRYNLNYPDATEEEKNSYAQKKLKMYSWYKGLNLFLKKIDEM